MRLRLIAVSAAALIALSACTSDADPAVPLPASASPSSIATADPPPEGPATREAHWPDDVTAKLVKVERVPNAWGVDVPADQAIIRVTMKVTNGGTVPLVMEEHTMFTTVYFGANRLAGDAEAGYSSGNKTDAKALQNDNPTRLAVGQTVTFIESASGPASDAGVLAVEARLPTATLNGNRPWTFTDAQELLTVVKG